MADEKKKQLYGGSYDEQIRDTAQQIQNRPAFSYDLDGDALYQQYKDRYTQNAKLGMKDTMGQAAALTGGYGNSYAQGVGQQRYDETMRGLTDMIPTLEQSAYQRWRDRGADLQNRYSMLSSMAATEQATGQQNYAQLAQLIGSSGYKPTEEELANAGMSADQANAMLQMWIASNPQLAYNNGQISAEDFYKMTGAYPIGYTPGAEGGSGGGGVNWWDLPDRNPTGPENEEARQQLLSALASSANTRMPSYDREVILNNASQYTDPDKMIDYLVSTGYITRAQAKAITGG
ncbi:MAG: hypothetical protein IKQ54_09440 [Oscillospiraceae bacterium]|nr:hypothetical protein [Oscillospiraceae bacterium]